MTENYYMSNSQKIDDFYEMVDIHSHILPAVDDGSFSMEMSEVMIKELFSQGSDRIFLTPHDSAFRENAEECRVKFLELQEKINTVFKKYSTVKIELYLGAEIRFDENNYETQIQFLNSGALPSLNGTKYVLTEFSSRITKETAVKIAKALLSDGWKPVIAHVERYSSLFITKAFEVNAIDALFQMGCLFQINVYSLYDGRDKEKEAARRLLEEQKVAFLGSDSHQMIYRAPNIKMGLRYIYEHCSREYADEVAYKNAEKFLLGKDN